MPETKECEVCHRIGYRSFVPSGSERWRCLRDDVCAVRAAKRVRAEHDLEVVAYSSRNVFVFGTTDERLARRAIIPSKEHGDPRRLPTRAGAWVWAPDYRWVPIGPQHPAARPGVRFAQTP